MSMGVVAGNWAKMGSRVVSVTPLLEQLIVSVVVLPVDAPQVQGAMVEG